MYLRESYIHSCNTSIMYVSQAGEWCKNLNLRFNFSCLSHHRLLLKLLTGYKICFTVSAFHVIMYFQLLYFLFLVKQNNSMSLIYKVYQTSVTLNFHSYSRKESTYFAAMGKGCLWGLTDMSGSAIVLTEHSSEAPVGSLVFLPFHDSVNPPQVETSESKNI